MDTNSQSVRHFDIAKSFSAEVITQAIIAFEIGYVAKEHFGKIESECKVISNMLTRLIQIRKMKILKP